MRGNFLIIITLTALAAYTDNLKCMGGAKAAENKARQEITDMVKIAFRKVHAYAMLKKKQQLYQQQEESRLQKSSSKEQIKVIVAEIFENIQKRRGVARCPICQEPLGRYPCTTLHKSAVGTIPHQFCTHCLYTWCQKTCPENCDKEKQIEIPCPLCHERDAKGKKDENGDYPLKKFPIAVAKLEDGFCAYAKKQFGLAERLADIEQLPHHLVVDTLLEYAVLPEKKRELAVGNTQKVALKLQHYVVKNFDCLFTNTIASEILAPTNESKDLIAKLVLHIVDGNHPLKIDFIGTIFDIFTPDEQIYYFEKSLGESSTLSDVDIIATKNELSTELHLERTDSAYQKSCDLTTDAEFVKDIRHLERFVFCGVCLPHLPIQSQTQVFGDLLKLDISDEAIRKKGIRRAFMQLAPEVQIAYFEDVYAHLSPDKKLGILIRLKDTLIQKYGSKFTLDLLDACAVLNQDALETYWPIMTDRERHIYFSRFLSTCASCYDDDDGAKMAAACIESIWGKIAIHRHIKYFETISLFINNAYNTPKIQVIRCQKIFEHLKATADTTCLSALYGYIQKNLEAEKLAGTCKQIFTNILPLIIDETTKRELTATTMDLCTSAHDKEEVLSVAWSHLSQDNGIQLFESYFSSCKPSEKLPFLKRFRPELPSPIREKCLIETMKEDPIYEIVTGMWSKIPSHMYARAFDSFFAPFYPLASKLKLPLPEKLREDLPLDLYDKLTQTCRKEDKLATLASEWGKIFENQRRDGLIFALLLIDNCYSEIFAITKPEQWLATCSFDEKADLLWTLWNRYPQNRLESYFTIFRYCDPDGKKTLQNCYLRKMDQLGKQRFSQSIKAALAAARQPHHALRRYHE